MGFSSVEEFNLVHLVKKVLVTMLFERGSPARCFVTPPPPSPWKTISSRSPSVPFSERKKSPNSANKSDIFHIIHKVPSGDSPYVKAKQVQVTYFFLLFVVVEFGCYFFWGYVLFLLVPSLLGPEVFLAGKKVFVPFIFFCFFGVFFFVNEYDGIRGSK